MIRRPPPPSRRRAGAASPSGQRSSSRRCRRSRKRRLRQRRRPCRPSSAGKVHNNLLTTRALRRIFDTPSQPLANACPGRQSRPYCPHEKIPVPAHALSSAIPAGGRLRHRRLRALSALSRGRVLDRGAGLRRRPADACCASRATLATYLFKNSVFGIVALIIATLHVMRPSIVLLTGGLIAAGFGIVLYNIVLSGIAIGLLILGFARPAPATA